MKANSKEHGMTCDAYKPLLMGYLDRELPDSDVALVEAHLAGCPDCSDDIEDFRRLKEVTHDMRVVTPDERYWAEYWSNVYNRLERKVGWILISVGIILVASYGLYQFLMEAFFDHHIPWPISVGVGALVVGFCTLLVSVVRERLFLAKSDKYERIKR
jgi:predicted anti-sigma-YlaC factor YlaD